MNTAVKQSRYTLNCYKQVGIKLALNSFLPVDEYMRLKENTKIHNNASTPTPEFDNTIDTVWEESDEGFDEATPLVWDTCAYSSINCISRAESKESLPVQDVWTCLRHHTCMKLEESTGDEDGGGVGSYARQSISKDTTRTIDDKEICTTSKHSWTYIQTEI